MTSLCPNGVLLQLDELKGRLNERRGQSSSCDATDGAVSDEADDKRNNNNSNSVSSQDDDGAVAPTLEDSTAAAGHYDYDDHAVAYGESLPDPLELWDTWPLLKWNAVA
jgi:homeobox-leucine zipper protein